MHQVAREERKVNENRERDELETMSTSEDGPGDVPDWLKEARKLMKGPRL